MKVYYDKVQLLGIALLALACGSARKSARITTASGPMETLLADSALVNAHVGVYVADGESGEAIAGHNEHKYFVPASNTKLWTLYAGMKYLGDSLVGGYTAALNDTTLLFRSNGDPTFLHPDYAQQALVNVLSRYRRVEWLNPAMRTTEYGNGWSWNDYDATYMAPRSSLPMFGNVATFSLKDKKVVTEESVAHTMIAGGADLPVDSGFSVSRRFDDPMFSIAGGRAKTVTTTLFLSPEANLKLAAAYFRNHWATDESETNNEKPQTTNYKRQTLQTLHTQPTDSMLRPLMHRSDNFFAEQTLLMVSNQWFGYMSERAVIDSLLRTDLAGLPDKPRWVDGSGLSRYNLFTPADYVWLLQKMKTEFPMDRIRDVLPTGNEGTLTNYYKALDGKIFAKTGTLAGVVALSGYLYAKSGRLLLFSALVNNHNGSAPAVRRAIERYLMKVWEVH